MRLLRSRVAKFGEGHGVDADLECQQRDFAGRAAPGIVEMDGARGDSGECGHGEILRRYAGSSGGRGPPER